MGLFCSAACLPSSGEVPQRICKCCSQPIAGTATVVGETFYHAECFKCKACGGQMGEYFEGQDGELFCSAACLHGEYKATAKICQGCAQPIEGNAIRVSDVFFHPECFKCAACGSHMCEYFENPEGERFCSAACQQSKIEMASKTVLKQAETTKGAAEELLTSPDEHLTCSPGACGGA